MFGHEYIDLNKLSADRFQHGDFIFVRAVTVESKRPILLKPARLTTGEPLFALPGGGRATKEAITAMLKAA